MTTLLHIASSPRGRASESLALADAFLDAYTEAHPDAAVDVFDLWDGTLPAFGRAATGAKMSTFAGQEPTGEQVEAWRAAERTFRRVAAADHYLFSVPMWNAGIPYILKQLIDVVSQPGMVFSFDPEAGYTGLLTGKKAATIYTSGVWGPGRSPSFGSNFAEPYLEDWLRWAGVEDISAVRFQPNLATTDAVTARQIAMSEARDLGKNF